jgi:hypothetical protein
VSTSKEKETKHGQTKYKNKAIYIIIIIIPAMTEYVMKAHEGVDVYIHVFLASALVRGE